MKINERLYPHPVQAHFSDDLEGCLFQVTPQVEPGKHSYRVSVTAKTSSKDLRMLIESGKAKYALHIECGATRFRKLITSTEETFQEEIAASRLDGRVELCSLIIATEDIPEYRNANFHNDYQGAAFSVKKGDVLAVSHDPLQNIASIFKVRENKSGPEAMNVELMGDNIVIQLSNQNFNFYSGLKLDQNWHTSLASMIILPTLVFVLESVRAAGKDNEDYVDRRWYRVLCRKLKEKGYNPDDPNVWENETSIVMAQNLIGDPLSMAIKTMYEMEDSGADE